MRDKEKKRIFRHKRIRKKVNGSMARPRLFVHRSLRNLHVQLIDDVSGKVILGMSTLSKEIRQKVVYGGNIDAARLLGESFAILAKQKGIDSVCFDRGGYCYHGRVKAFADAARSGGLKF